MEIAGEATNANGNGTTGPGPAATAHLVSSVLPVGIAIQAEESKLKALHFTLVLAVPQVRCLLVMQQADITVSFLLKPNVCWRFIILSMCNFNYLCRTGQYIPAVIPALTLKEQSS